MVFFHLVSVISSINFQLDIDECKGSNVCCSPTLSDQVFNNFIFYYVLIPRARTTVLAILLLLEMVLIVNVSLVFEGDEVFILFPTLNVAVNCLEFTFT